MIHKEKRVLETLLQDFRYAGRQLLRRPGFTLVAVLTLALGIGANTAMFSIVSATILEPLPYGDADRLVRVREVTPEGNNFSASEPNYLDFRDRSRSLEQLAAFKGRSASLTGNGDPVRIDGYAVTHDFFSVLGASAAVGRGFGPGDDLPAADNAIAVLAYPLWQQRFGGNRNIVGSRIVLDGRTHFVVGVMPSEFQFLNAEFWTPLAPDPQSDRGDHWLGMIGKLKPGVTPQMADAELDAIATDIGVQYPSLAGWSVGVEPLSHWLVGSQFRSTVYLLFGAVGFLLLMMCVNLANLLIVRASLRQQEMGIRSALGAKRMRIARQLLTEAVLLSLLGAVAGLALASAAVGALHSIGPDVIPRLDEIRIDVAVFGFALLTGALAGILFGVAPALRASRVNPAEVLQQGNRSGATREHRRLRDVLVVAQISLAMLLLIGASLLIHGFMELRNIDPGFRAEHVFAVQLQLGEDRYPEGRQKTAFFKELEERLGGAPGVASVGATAVDPFSGNNLVNDVTPVALAAQTGPGGLLQTAWRPVTPGFFNTMKIPLLQGRLFTYGDTPDAVVVTRTMAEQLWPDESAVGKRFYWGSTTGTPRTVIGVVGDYHDVKLDEAAQPVMFLPHDQASWPQMTVLIRTGDEIVGIRQQVREHIHAIDPGLPVASILPLEQKLSSASSIPRFRAILVGVFAVLALLLAATGIYGVMAFSVSQRRREMGLRMAMGAEPTRIFRLLFSDGMRLALTGSLLGLLASFGLTRLMQGLLYGTGSGDPIAIGVAVGSLLLVALLAIWVPGRRAMRIEPMQAFREE